VIIRAIKGFLTTFFLIVEGHSKDYFSYIMPEYPVKTNYHEKNYFPVIIRTPNFQPSRGIFDINLLTNLIKCGRFLRMLIIQRRV